MKCPNCDGFIRSDSKECPHCGASLAPQRVIPGNKHEEFSLSAENEPFKLGDDAETDVWRLDAEPVIDQTSPQVSQVESEVDQADAQDASESERVEWGGFMRRAGAFLIDYGVILLLAVMLFTLSYIGYKVGLAAHGKVVRWENAPALVVLLMLGGIGLSAAYFVVFHGMDGQTIGKRLLGLRVVGPEQGAVTCKQAFVRWLAAASFAPIGLGWLWVLWSREKRAWHDIFARTWVIRVQSRG